MICRVEGAACIAFGAPGIELSLNGFTITGLADPAVGCGGANVRNEFGMACGVANVVDVADMRMTERRNRARFLFEALPPIWIVGKLTRQEP